MKKAFFVLMLAFGVSSTVLLAQSRHYTSQSLGMGNGGTAYVEGYHANFVNPANLMLDLHRQKTHVGLANFGLTAGGSLANVAVYNEYLTTGNLIAGQTRVDMLDAWFGENAENMRKMSTTVSIAPIGASHRREKQAYSLVTRVRVTEQFGINKGMAELLTYGLDSEIFSNPVPVNFLSKTVVFGEISLGYARHLDMVKIPDLFFAKDIKLYVGAAPKYLYGVYAADLDFNSTLQMDQGGPNEPFTIHHRFNYDLKTIGELSRQLQEYEQAYNLDNDAELGDYVDYEGDDIGEIQASGFGLDLGGTLEMDISEVPIPLFVDKEKTLRISMSLTDLGTLKFDNNASTVYADADFSYVGMQDEDDLDTFFENLADSLQNDVYGKFSSEEIDALEYKLPAMYNFGASLEMGKLLLALDYGFGFNNNGVNSRRSALNLGAQYRLFGFMPIRVGTRLGGYSSATFSAGFGFDFNVFEFSFAGSLVSNSENHGTSAAMAWSGLTFRF